MRNNVLFCSDTNGVTAVTQGFFHFLRFSVMLLLAERQYKFGEERNMKVYKNRSIIIAAAYLTAFLIWTILIQTVDVKPIGQAGTCVGFAGINGWFHDLTGVHWLVYTVTDWLGLVPIFVCVIFAALGAVQLFTRRSFFKVDFDIRILGVYYVLVIICYLIFEMIPINYRPILIEGRLEASYPSSTTLLVLCVMPTLTMQAERRVECTRGMRLIRCFSLAFSLFMVVGRLISGVHWLSDIVGAVLLSRGLSLGYKGIIMTGEEQLWNWGKSCRS